MYPFSKVTVGGHLAFLLLLLVAKGTGTQGQVNIPRCFPNKATYIVGQRANFTCPRPCGDDGGGIGFYIFNSGQSIKLSTYLRHNGHGHDCVRDDCADWNDCAGRDANTDGSVIASFEILPQDSGTILYCTDGTSISPCDSLIQPVLIHLEECNNTTSSSPSPVYTSSPSPVSTSSPSPVRTLSPSPVRTSSPSPVHTLSPSPLCSVNSPSPTPASVSAALSSSIVGGIAAGSFIAGLLLGGLLMGLTCGIGLIIAVNNTNKASPGLNSPTMNYERANMSNDTPSLSSNSSA